MILGETKDAKWDVFHLISKHSITIFYITYFLWIINDFEKFQSMSIIAIRYNRRQETVLMPKLSLKQQNLEFNWHVRRQVLACKQVHAVNRYTKSGSNSLNINYRNFQHSYQQSRRSQVCIS